MRYLRFCLLILFICASVYFSIYNQERVALQLPPWIEHITAPAYSVYLAFFFSGAIIVSIYFSVDSLRKSLVIRKLRKQLREFGVDTTGADELVASSSADERDPNQ